jgi:hypothetical protein
MNQLMRNVKENYQLFLLFFIFILIKIITLFKTHQIIWDESVYIGMGKYLFSLGNAGLWESIRPIGLPLFLGILWKLKLDTVIFSEILVVLFSIGNIWLTYLIAKHTFNKRTAIIAAFLLAITPLFFLYGSYILTGITSTFFALLALYIYFSKKNLKLVGVFTALTFLFRFPQGLLLVAIILSLFINESIRLQSLRKTLKGLVGTIQKDYFPFLVSFFLTLLPFLIFNFLLYRQYTTKAYHAIFRPFILSFSHQANPVHVISSFFSNISYYLNYLVNENLFFVFLFIAIIFFFKNKEYKNYRATALMVVAIIYWLYFTLIINKQPRFSLVFLPYFAILAAYGINSTLNFVKKQKDYFKYISYIALLIFSIFSIMQSVDIIDDQFGWRIYDEFPITIEFYKYFLDKPSTNLILTTNPVHAAYTDNKYIPFYFSVKEGTSIYIANRNKAQAVIYSPDSFVCFDQECEKKLQDLFFDIKKRFDLVFEKQYNDRTYYIFEKST